MQMKRSSFNGRRELSSCHKTTFVKPKKSRHAVERDGRGARSETTDQFGCCAAELRAHYKRVKQKEKPTVEEAARDFSGSMYLSAHTKDVRRRDAARRWLHRTDCLASDITS